MSPEQKQTLDKLHNEHASIWSELEQLRTDILVVEKDGQLDLEAEKKQLELEEKLEKKDRDIQDFLEKYKA